MATEAVTYSVKLPARTLHAVPASGSAGRSQWVVGTTSLREENEVRVLEYDAASDRLNSVAAWVHPAEVWDIACCPEQPTTFITVHSTAGVKGATLWQAGQSGTELQPSAQLQHEGNIHRVLWSSVDSSKALTVEDGALRLWDVGGAAAVQAATVVAQPEHGSFWAAALHPKDAQRAVSVAGSNLQLWDLRSMTCTSSLPSGHRPVFRDVDWAPHNEHRFVTGSDDGKLRFWDTRMLDQPQALLELTGHSHWVWKVAYSPFHDPLLLSSSTDTTVCVWFTPALAKAKDPQTKPTSSRATGGAARSEGVDGKVHTFDEHEDSAYGLSWSAVDPWLFASMSYDGRLVLNTVPKNIKYKILI